MSRLEGFNDIPIPVASVKRIAAALSHVRQALQSIPAASVADDPLLTNYAGALHQTRVQLQSTASVLEHLLERAASCH